MLKAFLVFLIFLAGNTIFTVTTFWQIKHAKNLTLNLILFEVKFQSLWTFWLAYCAILIPAFFVINYAFLFAYWYGYNVVFQEKAWPIQLIIWLQSVLVMFFVGWLYLGELPAKNMVVALLFLLGAVSAIIWK